MQNDIFHIKEHHIQAAEMVMNELKDKTTNKRFIIAISGELSSGKSTLAYLVARMLKKKGVRSKIMDLSDYYKIPPLERRADRKKNGLDTIGMEEYDWIKIQAVRECFRNGEIAFLPSVDMLTDEVDFIKTDFKNVQVLFVSGLFAFHCNDVDYKIFMERTFREAYESQEYLGKEVEDEFRKKVLDKEHEVVQRQKNDADIYIDFNAFLNSYHL